MNTLANKQTITFPIRSLDGKNINQYIKLDLNIPTKYFDKNHLNNKTNYIVHRAFQTQMLNEKQGTANTLTRAEIRGGGKKPWKQKGTGRARAGSNRSPLWKGGGVCFGPKTKTYKRKINRQEWRLSLRLLFLKKLNNIIVVDQIPNTSFKTKHFTAFIKSLNLNYLEKIAIISPIIDNNLQLAAQNLKEVTFLKADCVNIKDLLLAKYLIIETKSLKILQKSYNDY